MGKFIDLTGQRFGRLTVLSRAEDYVNPQGNHYVKWLCICDCGNITTVLGTALRSGGTRSCGCLQKIKHKTNYYDWDSAEYLIGYTFNGDRFILDKSDYDLVKDYCWSISDRGYVVAHSIDNYDKSVKMHRLLFDNCENMFIDHINHDTTDNRRSNLRIVTQSQNQMNVIIRKDNSSGVAGVNYNKNYDKWVARIGVDKKRIYLGCYDTFDEAVKARKEAEEKYFGEYSYDNSINKNKEESA